MKRKEKNDLLKRMASVMDRVLVQSSANMQKDTVTEIVALLRECDENMPHFVTPSTPRQYIRLLTEGKLDLSIVEKR